MGDVYIERRTVAKPMNLSWDLAHHISARPMTGCVVVVTDKPTSILASVRKQWLRLIGQLLREQSATLGPMRKQQLNKKIHYMRSLYFTARPIGHTHYERGVLFVAPAAVESLPPRFCHTVYITCPLDGQLKDKAIERILHHGLCVVYE